MTNYCYIRYMYLEFALQGSSSTTEGASQKQELYHMYQEDVGQLVFIGQVWKETVVPAHV